MKYVKRKRNNLFFTKRWPEQLRVVIGSVGFSYPLGSVEQSEAQVTAKVSKALAEYDVKVKLATNSDTEDYHQNEIDVLVEANLRRMKQTHGMPQFKLPYQHVIDHYENDFEPDSAEDIAAFGTTSGTIEQRKQWEAYAKFHGLDTNSKTGWETFCNSSRTVASEEFIRTKGQMASSLVPELDAIQFKEKTGQKLTMKDKVAGATWVALQNKAKKRPRMLHEQWDVYTKFNDLQTTSKTDWNTFCGLIQNRSINISPQGHQDLSRELNETLRDYRDIRIEKVKVTTVKRELQRIRACLNWITNEYVLDWNLSKTMLQKPKDGQVVQRIPLSLEHQKMLVAYCLSPEHSHEPAATMALLYLMGGIMPTEIERMDAELQLKNLSNAVAPHLTIVGKTKTVARQRPVPVVIGLNVIKANLAKTIAWAKAGNRFRNRQNLLDAATGTEGLYVSHGLRHSLSANCRDSNCRDDDKCTLGGWSASGSASAVSRGYGAGVMFSQSNIERLFKVSQDVHRNLM